MAQKATEIMKEPGVADLKGKCRMTFALAIKAEQEGDHAHAAELLDKAVAAESAVEPASE